MRQVVIVTNFEGSNDHFPEERYHLSECKKHKDQISVSERLDVQPWISIAITFAGMISVMHFSWLSW